MNLEGNERTIQRWNNSITERTRRRLRATAFPAGAVIFPKIGAAIATNKKRVLRLSSCVDNNVMAVVPNPTLLDTQFLYFLLLTKNLSDFASDSNPPSIRKTVIEGWHIPVPPLTEQLYIVDMLSRAEGIVRLRREAQKKAADIIPALFLDMFGDPLSNPKGWPRYALKTACQVSYGIADKLDTTITAEQGVRILTISNVRIDGTIDNEVKRYCVPTADRLSKATVQRGDLLFNWRNGSETHIGKTAIWQSDQSVLHVSFLLRLRPIDTRASAAYLWTLLSLLRASGYFVGASRQQVNRKFNASELSELLVPLPPIELQRQFETKWQATISITRQLGDASTMARNAFNALLNQVFCPGGLHSPRQTPEELTA